MTRKIFFTLLPFWIIQFFITLIFTFGRHYGELATYLTENHESLAMFFSVIIMPSMVGIILGISKVKISTVAWSGASISLGTFMAYFANTFQVTPISLFLEQPLAASSYFLMAVASLSTLMLPLQIIPQVMFSILSTGLTQIVIIKFNQKKRPMG